MPDQLFVRTVLALTVFAVVEYGTESVASEDENPSVYQVVIEGKTFRLKDGNKTQVVLDDGKAIQITVSLSPRQPYRTKQLQFEYDVGLSLDDDKDAAERTVLLLHATGCGIVISEKGQASDTDQPQLLKDLVDSMLDLVRRGVAKDITTAKTKAVEFSHAKGIMTTSTHLDEDNDRITHYYYVLQSGNRVASVIGFHDQESTAVYAKIQKTLLDSLQETKQEPVIPSAGNGT
jgi:hypothetical protein